MWWQVTPNNNFVLARFLIATRVKALMPHIETCTTPLNTGA